MNIHTRERTHKLYTIYKFNHIVALIEILSIKEIFEMNNKGKWFDAFV